MDYLQELCSLKDSIKKEQKFNGRASLLRKIGNRIRMCERLSEKNIKLMYLETLRDVENLKGGKQEQKKLFA